MLIRLKTFNTEQLGVKIFQHWSAGSTCAVSLNRERPPLRGAPVDHFIPLIKEAQVERRSVVSEWIDKSTKHYNTPAVRQWLKD